MDGLLISDFAKRALTYYWENPVGKNPAWFKKRKSVRNWVGEYFEFPTPGKSMKYIKGKSRRRFLFRWVKEYSYFSQFTHIALEKQLIPYMSQHKGAEAVWKTEVSSRNLLEKVIFVSFTSVASACLLITNELRDSYGARANLQELWSQLEQTSLLGRAFWNIYPKKLLR
ncbi:MAG: hypothetical protein H7Z16_19605 [Pyrinomonadaceae bacterium]|nr:hypothetical protein [Pyrinomonadaceae bacterium]